MKRQWFAVLPLVALWSLLSWLTVEAVNIRAICDGGDLDESLITFCKSLDSFYSPTNDLYQWDDDVTDDDSFTFGGSRERRDAAMMPDVRARRGGNYIRFGRSISDLSADPSVRRTLLASFGAPTRRTSNGHYMRFGRSVDHVTSDETSEKRAARSTNGEDGRAEEGRANFVRLARPFMRFGRSRPGEPTEAEKRAFMRFGRSRSEDDGDATKRAFMRFGRNSGSPDRDDDDDDDDDVTPYEMPDKKAFMRFGKRAFMRFGRRDDDDWPEVGADQKRFMRFGRTPPEIERDGAGSEKRFMRFGKRAFMRFGRGGSDVSDDDESTKRAFMRFGRRPEEDEAEGPEKRFMRFGRSGSDDEAGKRFMRFGRKDGTEAEVDEKRFMRFGKRQQAEVAEATRS